MKICKKINKFVFASLFCLFTSAVNLAFCDSSNKKFITTSFGELGNGEEIEKFYKKNAKLRTVYLHRVWFKNHFLKNYRGAIEDCNRIIRNHPKSSNQIVYVERGFAKRALGDIEGAIRDYNKAIEADLKYAVAYSDRGLIKAHLGDNEGAIRDYNKAIELNPKSVFSSGAYRGLGDIKFTSGNYEGAIKDYTKAIEVDSENIDAYYNRGMAKDMLNNNKGAIRDYKKAEKVTLKMRTGFYKDPE